MTCNEAEIDGEEIRLIEGKHTSTDRLPSDNDIKDGLLKIWTLDKSCPHK